MAQASWRGWPAVGPTSNAGQLTDQRGRCVESIVGCMIGIPIDVNLGDVRAFCGVS
jgi:hypothetical protein